MIDLKFWIYRRNRMSNISDTLSEDLNSFEGKEFKWTVTVESVEDFIPKKDVVIEMLGLRKEIKRLRLQIENNRIHSRFEILDI